MDFERVMKSVAQFFEGEELAYAIIGAFGLHAYGLSRATSDLDFVTDFQAQAKLIPFLEKLGYETLHVSSGYSNHVHVDPAMGRVDFVYVSGDTSRQLLGFTKRLNVLGGISVAVPRPEHLAAMKIQAMKNDPERTYQEMADLQFLLGLPEINEEEIKSYFEKQELLDRYYEIKRILENARPEP